MEILSSMKLGRTSEQIEEWEGAKTANYGVNSP
jgi:hypothetical protein